ncbi:MAG: HAD hydrolase family protein [Clostridia bacterium]|nr:HAD hydrolase family protein [Clostridia bacterium]
MKTLYISDLDGTLLTKDERISKYSLDILNDLIGRGMLFTFATARSLVTARKATVGLEYACPAILYNGAMIKDLHTGKLFDVEHFTPSQIDFFTKFFRENHISPFVYASIDGAEKVSWLKGTETDGMKRYLSRRTGDERLNPVESFDRLFLGNVFYFNCIGAKQSFEHFVGDLKKNDCVRMLFTQETYQSDYWLEIMPKKASKGDAALKLKSIVGADRIVCFGDGENDVGLFGAADESYAVLNAIEELKRVSTGVIGYSEEDSVAKWLSKHCELSRAE